MALGEHMGQLFTIAWTLLMATALHHLKIMPRWMTGLAYGSSLIYAMAQLDLFATLIPGTPVWGAAGSIGSTLWLLWLLLMGVRFVRSAESQSAA